MIYFSGEDGLFNGVIVKQELMLDYEHCDETQPSDDAFEENGFPIITCIKSEYSQEGKVCTIVVVDMKVSFQQI